MRFEWRWFAAASVRRQPDVRLVGQPPTAAVLTAMECRAYTPNLESGRLQTLRLPKKRRGNKIEKHTFRNFAGGTNLHHMMGLRHMFGARGRG